MWHTISFMRIHRLVLIVGILGTIVCGTANASVVYSFSWPFGTGYSFQLTTPTFLSSPYNVGITIPAANLDSCTTTAPFTCSSVVFFPSGSAHSLAATPEIDFATSGSINNFYFSGGYGSTGVFTDNLRTQVATLTVTGSPSVPEPKSFILFISSVLVFLLQRRRTTTSSTINKSILR